MKEERVNFYNDKKQKLVGHYYKNRSDTLLIYSHGAESFSKFAKEMIPFFEAYFNLGLSLFWFDFTRYGESEGKGKYNHSQRVSDIGKVLEYFNGKYTKIILCGISAGAIPASVAATKYKRITKLYVVNGFYELKHTYPKFYIPTLLGYLTSSEIRNETIYIWKNLKPEKIEIPTLVVVGANDKVVNPKQSLSFYQKLRRKKKLVVIPDGDHGLLDHKYISQYLGDIGEWLLK